MKNAALYVTDPSLIGSKILDRLSGLIKSYSSVNQGENAVGMIVHLDGADVECNFMPPEELAAHLDSFRNFAFMYMKENVSPQYLSTRIDNVRFVIGCIGHYEGNYLKKEFADFMSAYNTELRSMLFCGDALWDFDGECLAALP